MSGEWLGGLPMESIVRAVVDILVLAFLIYQILLLLRGTRGVRALYGIFALGVLWWLTGPDRAFELPAVHRVVGWALFFIPFVIVILFQNHIRRALATLGRNPFSALRAAAGRREGLVDEVVLAVTSLASRRHGALIVLEREQGLRTFVETGIDLDANVSYDLLTTIFLPGSPLHDGAVIIGDDTLRAASCYLPLASNPRLSKEFGSRHRAAVGISEETDAVAVVVSEERGTVSLARDGTIQHDLTARELEETLRSLLPEPVLLLARFPRLRSIVATLVRAREVVSRPGGAGPRTGQAHSAGTLESRR